MKPIPLHLSVGHISYILLNSFRTPLGFPTHVVSLQQSELTHYGLVGYLAYIDKLHSLCSQCDDLSPTRSPDICKMCDLQAMVLSDADPVYIRGKYYVYVTHGVYVSTQVKISTGHL